MRQLNKLYYKARDYLVACFAILWVKTPWFKAVVRTALMAYYDSLSYRIRRTEMGPEFAFRSFFEYNELGYWKRLAVRDGRMNWWKIVFTPFAVHQDARFLLDY